MTKNKTIYVAFRMTELEVSKLEYLRQPGETRSSAIRWLINDAWEREMVSLDEQNDYPSISDRVNCF